MLPGFAPPALALDPHQPGAVARVHGQRDERRSDNTRIDGVSTAHIQLPHVVSYIPTSNRSRRSTSSPNSMERNRASPAGGPSTCRPGADPTHPRIAFEHYTDQHLKAWPMRFGDAALNTRRQAGGELQPIRRHHRRPHQKNKAFFFVSYESTRDHRTVDRTVTVPTRAMLKGDLSCLRPRSTILCRAIPDGSGRTQFRVLPGDPNYGLCKTARTRTASTSFRRPGWTRSP